jgi:hypothetical protein
MPTRPQVSVSRPQRIVWLRVVLCERDPLVCECLRRRLSAYLRGSGISPVTSARRIALLCSTGPITPFDVSSVVAWLVEQPEVLLVCRERPAAKATLRAVGGSRTHG